MSGQQCFDRNNNEDRRLVRCSSDGKPSSCCSPGDGCASNGLCVAPLDANTLTPYFIHGCSVDNWQDPTCLKVCDQSNGNGVKPCGNSQFCCYGLGGCNCSDTRVVFSLEPVRIVTTIPKDILSRTSTTAVTTTPSSSPTNGGTGLPQTSSGPTGTPANTQSPENSPAATLAIGLGVGLGVGIPLIIVALGALWFFKRRSTRDYPKDADHPPVSQPENWNGQQSVSPQSWGGHTTSTPNTGGWVYDQSSQSYQSPSPQTKHELDPHPSAPSELPSEPQNRYH